MQHRVPMLVSHLFGTTCLCLLNHPGCQNFCVQHRLVFVLFFSPPSSFVDESIYYINIGRALERLKQYRSGLITTVNVPQTWSTDRRVFMCMINTNTPSPVWLFGGQPSPPREGHWQLWASCQHAAFSFAIFMQWIFNIYSFRFDTSSPYVF